MGRDGRPSTSESRNARQTSALHSWPPRRLRAYRDRRRPRPACVAARDDRAARRTHKRRPCRCGGSAGGSLNGLGHDARLHVDSSVFEKGSTRRYVSREALPMSGNPYAPPTAVVADVTPGLDTSVETPFFAVSPLKLAIMSICTLNFY